MESEWTNGMMMSVDGSVSAAASSAKKLESNGIALTNSVSTKSTTSRLPRNNHLVKKHHLGLSIVLSSLLYQVVILHHPARAQQAGLAFPGVSRDLASFCSARPSLSIDLAPMLVHVKKNTSFNYKLYLFSSDEHVFQTGQIVPRDDFRVHSFPVKLKPLGEFVPMADPSLEIYQSRNQTSDLVRVPNSAFQAERFFARVPLLPERRRRGRRAGPESTTEANASHGRHRGGTFPHDVQGDMLPGDSVSFAHHDAGSAPEDLESHVPNANAHIEFDRDDQLAVLNGPQDRLRALNRRHSVDHQQHQHQHAARAARGRVQGEDQATVLPVGSFSSFRVNHTYLARKDFDQQQVELIRLRVDPQRFQVSRVDILLPLKQQQQQQVPTGKLGSPSSSLDQQEAASELPAADDYAFLSHKLLRDPSKRLTSISQIYEDWITRNFYTIVYIQRRPNQRRRTGRTAPSAAAEEEDGEAGDEGDRDEGDEDEDDELITERLVFRGSSTVLLGADQLNYHVKASAFITEKNGLHYYLEFLPNGKFYLGAIDWTKRPFKFIDSQRFPIKPTRTQFDNEELLLCPPSVCYSDQPIDELVAYGRLPLSDKLQREAAALAKSSSGHSESREGRSMAADGGGGGMLATIIMPETSEHSVTAPKNTTGLQSDSISLDNLIDAMKAASSRLDMRLHLRDWLWQVPRVQQQQVSMKATQTSAPSSKFTWHYEWAKRNELKVAPDTYGFALVGHEIDASYRVFNELYLISANQLIAINYTLANETVTSVLPLEDEFPGLSSSLLDPITGAFYDRYSNQIYFFKGDRYVGYDYATKRPLEDFLLPPAVDDSLGGLGLALMMRHEQAAQQQQQQPPSADANLLQRPLVSSLPVVGILGRQHYVDAIYHDLHEDLVYVLTGMKFYTQQAADFKDGAFRAPRSGGSATGDQPSPVRCINEHLLAGCRFDAAFPNPCKSSDKAHDGNRLERQERPGSMTTTTTTATTATRTQGEATWRVIRPDVRETSFGEEQQMRLRSIAARGGGPSNGRLMDYLLENTLVAQGAARAFEPFLGNGGGGGGGGGSTGKSSSRASEQEQIVIYLLIAMVLTTVLVTVAMIVVVLNWARLKSVSESHSGHQVNRNKLHTADHQRNGATALGLTSGQLLAERPVYPTAISQYLSSQYQRQQHHQARPRPPISYYYGQPQQFTGTTRRLSSGMPAPISAAPPVPTSTAEPPPRRLHQQQPQQQQQFSAQTLTPDLVQNGAKSKRPNQYNSLMNNSAF